MPPKIDLTDNQVKQLFYTVMRDMILEIRSEAHEKGLKKIYHQADLIHNLPAVLRYDESTSESEKLQGSYDWFSAHLKYDNPFSDYLKKKLKVVLSQVKE